MAHAAPLISSPARHRVDRRHGRAHGRDAFPRERHDRRGLPPRSGRASPSAVVSRPCASRRWSVCTRWLAGDPAGALEMSRRWTRVGLIGAESQGGHHHEQLEFGQRDGRQLLSHRDYITGPGLGTNVCPWCQTSGKTRYLTTRSILFDAPRPHRPRGFWLRSSR